MQRGEQIAVDRLERAQIRVGKPAQVPFTRAAADILEIIPARAIRSDEDVAEMRVTMDRHGARRQAVHRCAKTIECTAQKIAIGGAERRLHRFTLEQAAAVIHLVSKVGQFSGKDGQRLMQAVQRLGGKHHVPGVFVVGSNVLNKFPKCESEVVLDVRACRQFGGGADDGSGAFCEVTRDVALSGEPACRFPIMDADGSCDNI